jgi:hypothetical protein
MGHHLVLLHPGFFDCKAVAKLVALKVALGWTMSTDCGITVIPGWQMASKLSKMAPSHLKTAVFEIRFWDIHIHFSFHEWKQLSHLGMPNGLTLDGFHSEGKMENSAVVSKFEPPIHTCRPTACFTSSCQVLHRRRQWSLLLQDSLVTTQESFYRNWRFAGG